MKKRTFEQYLISENVYRCPVLFLVGDEEKSRKAMIKELGDDKDFDFVKDMSFKSKSAKTIFRARGCVIWLRDRDNLPALVHEIMHYVLYILEARGVIIESRNDEPAAYLAEYMFNMCITNLGLKKHSLYEIQKKPWYT